jgi:hypothetical protein
LPISLIKFTDVLTGDEAYLLKLYLMRPFPQNNLTPDKSAFNYGLSRTRSCVECTFGMLCAKWRVLTKDIETDPGRAYAVIKAACMLHSFIGQLDGAEDPHFIEFHNKELSSQEPSVSTRSNNSFAKWPNISKLILQIISNATQLTVMDEILIVSLYKI